MPEPHIPHRITSLQRILQERRKDWQFNPGPEITFGAIMTLTALYAIIGAMAAIAIQ